MRTLVLLVFLCVSASGQMLSGIVGDTHQAQAGGGAGISAPTNISKHSNTANSNTVPVSFGLTPTVGHTVLVFTAGGQSGAFSFNIPTDNQGGQTYTVLRKEDGGGSGSQIACAVITAASGTFTVTTTTSANTYLTSILWEVTGVGCTTDGVDSKLNAGGTAVPCYVTGITTSHADMIIGFAGSNNGTNSTGWVAGTTGVSYTISAGGSEEDGATFESVASEYFIASSTGTFTPSFAQSNSTGSSCSSVAVY